MIRFFQKLYYMVSKMNHRTHVECELNYIREHFEDLIKRDELPLRQEMAKLKAIQQPNGETKKKIMDLEKEIDEIMTHKAMIFKGEEKIAELTSVIEDTKKFLWK